MRTAVTDHPHSPSLLAQPVDPCHAQNGEAVGALLRLAFHDAAGGGGPLGAGGPNGCVDATTSKNAGLADVQARLDLARAPFVGEVSRADFFVLAANVAVELATTTPDSPAGRAALAASGLEPVGAPLVLEMRFGRLDDASCAGRDGVFLPDPSCTWLGLVDVFGTGGRFQMNNAEVTAIMGAHSVGRLHKGASGLSGGWSATQSSFSTSYFRSLLTQGFSLDATQSPDVYVGSGPSADGAEDLVMLRADIELVAMTVPTSDSEDFANSPAVSTTCRAFGPGVSAAPGACPFQARSIDVVRSFAAPGGTGAFFATWSTAWTKLTQLGYLPSGARGLVVDPRPPPVPVVGFGGAKVPRAH